MCLLPHRPGGQSHFRGLRRENRDSPRERLRSFFRPFRTEPCAFPFTGPFAWTTPRRSGQPGMLKGRKKQTRAAGPFPPWEARERRPRGRASPRCFDSLGPQTSKGTTLAALAEPQATGIVPSACRPAACPLRQSDGSFSGSLESSLLGSQRLATRNISANAGREFRRGSQAPPEASLTTAPLGRAAAPVRRGPRGAFRASRGACRS